MTRPGRVHVCNATVLIVVRSSLLTYSIVDMEQPPPNTEQITSIQGSQSINPSLEQANASGPGSDRRISNEQDADTAGDFSSRPKNLGTRAPGDLTQLGEFTYYVPNPNQTRNNARGCGCLYPTVMYDCSTRIVEDPPSPDFFEPTAEDLRSAQASLASRSRAYQDAPLLTERLRNERNQEIRTKYPTATIRIKFANRSMLEKTFPSSSVIKLVYAFVRSCLNEDAKAHKFVLFETPPRRDLRVSDPNVRDKTLFDLHLSPRSILHFRFLDDSVELDSITGPPPLYPEILSQAIELPLPAPFETPSSSTTTQSASSGKVPSDSSDKGKKIARLLRLSGKR
ncbi:hypothetical protein ACEPAF_8533 [Sanghuangporus sanghuang]